MAYGAVLECTCSMVYAFVTVLAITLMALLLALGLLVFRGGVSFGSVRWYPNWLGLSVLALLVGVVAWRFFPGFVFVLFILPFAFRWRRHRGPRSTVEGEVRGVDDGQPGTRLR